MHIRRYEAATLEEAIARIKEELGPDALVLSTRRVRRDGGLFGWLGRPVVEVTAAVDRDARRAPARSAAEPSSPQRGAHPSWRELSITSALLEPLEAELRALRRSVDGIAHGDDTALREELAELRRHVERLGTKASGRRDPVVERLLAAGFAAQAARVLAADARERCDADGGDPRAALAAALAARLDARLAPARDDAPLVTLYVGACGVGKTTTVAKLAGRLSGVGLVTTDVHRAGGAEPLRALAEAHRLPLAAATGAEDALRRIDALRASRVLVDTCGAGRSDPAAIAEVVRLRDALGRRAAVHLVLSATTKEEDLRAELQRFSRLAPDAIVVARSDETERLASVANLLLDERTPPLVWLGTGRRVPDDLAVPEPHALAERMLGVAA